jgi:hypothetical protein
MLLLSLDYVMGIIDKAADTLFAATEPSPEQIYAIEYTVSSIKDAITKEYERNSNE